jgi:hypothetical protein
MSKISASNFLASSRLLTAYPYRFTLVPTQQADLIVPKKTGPYYNLIYLPLDYHCQNPGYISFKLTKVLQSAGESRTMVLVLIEGRDYMKRVGEIQSECIRSNVNMILFFEVEEIKEFLDDLIAV